MCSAVGINSDSSTRRRSCMARCNALRATYEKLRVQLNEQDRVRVRYLLRQSHELARVLRRATILSLLDKGESASTVSRLLDVSPTTVRKIGRLYNQYGLEAAIYDSYSMNRWR